MSLTSMMTTTFVFFYYSVQSFISFIDICVTGWLIAGRLEQSPRMNWSWNVYSCICYPCILPCYACIFDVMKETLVGIRAFFVGMRAYWCHERALFMTSVLPLRSMKTKCWRSKADWGSDVPCTLDGIRYCASAPRSPEVCVVHRSAKTELGEF
jgi:hypothetical protein